MNDEIFLVQDGQRPVKMESQPYESEDLLQRLLAENPEILGSRDQGGSPTRWALIAREQGIPDAAEAADRWSLDHLFVDQDAVPTLVEVKRAADTRARREVVAQMLDYAANGIVHWPIADLRAGFARTCLSQDRNVAGVISELMDGDVAEDEFWRRVEGNLRQGRVRLVFVADEIPGELRRIVEFLNGQMRPAIVLALEVKQYVSTSGIRTLVPRLLGNTAAAEDAKAVSSPLSPISLDEWMHGFSEANGSDQEKIARDIVGILQSVFDEVEPTKSQDAVYAGITLDGYGRYPIFLRKTGWVEIAMRWLQYSPIFKSDASRQEVLVRAAQIPGAKLTTQNLVGFPALKLTMLASQAAQVAFKEFAGWLAARLREEGK